MTDPDPLDRLIDLAIQQAERVLIGKPNAALLPSFVIEGASGAIAILATPWSSDRDKEITAQALRATMRESGVVRYSSLSEAWMAMAPPDITPEQARTMRLRDDQMPSQRPDRIEVVIIAACDRTTSKSALLRIVRGEAGTVVRLDRDQAGDKILSGRFANLLQPDDDPDL